MKQFLFTHKKAIIAMGFCVVLAGVTMSFQTPFGPLDKVDTLTELQDTVPEVKKHNEDRMSMKEYDELISKMDQEILKIQQQFGKMDLSKMHQDLATSLDKVDFDKIKRDIDKSMKDVDFDKIEKGVKSALSQIEWSNINAEVKRSLQDARKEIDKVDMQELKKELDRAKREIEKSKKEIQKINFDQVLKEANEGILKAKEELKSTRVMFTEMEKEGLISRKDGFSIEFKNKALIINGKKQPDATFEKYKKYVKGDSFKIAIGEDNK
ncbi:MAG: hypothetical protein V4725_12525 [Bacteroidota bacterium]